MYYFASDIHLGMDASTTSSQRERLFIHWLEEVSADAKAIFLVGDIFDFWFEYKRVIPKGFTRVLGKFSDLTDRGVEIHFFTGNHDMWAYDYLAAECGVSLHFKPEVFELCGKKLFIAHGDNMYIKKPLKERFMHWCFHSTFVRKVFAIMIHPDLTMRFGQWWSNKSRKSHNKTHIFRGEDEYLIQYARAYNKCIRADWFIFGHIHYAGIYPLDGDSSVVFLGEWLHEPTYAVMTPDGRFEIRNCKPQ